MTQPTTAPQPPRSRAWVWILAGVLFVIVCLAALLILALRGVATPGAGTPAMISAESGLVLVALDMPDGGTRIRAIDPARGLDRVIFEGAEVTEMRVSPDGKRVVVAGMDDTSYQNECLIIDPWTDGSAMPVVPEAVPGEGLSRPLDVLSADWLADGSAVFAMYYSSDDLVVTSFHPDTGDREVVGHVTEGIALSLFCPRADPNAAVMGVLDVLGESGVVVIDEDGAENATGYPDPHWGIVSPEGDRVLVQETAGSRAWTIFPATQGELASGVSVDTPSQYYTCADWSPSGDRVVIDAAIYNSMTGERVTKLDLAGPVQDVWFVDENRVAALVNERVLLIDAETGRSEVLVNRPTASPTSSRAWRGLRNLLGL